MEEITETSGLDRKPLTGASYEDYLKVADKVTVVRYMANVVLENVRATFDAEAEEDGGKSQEQQTSTQG